MSPRRVVVTGLGAVTPLGNTIEETWQAILAGKSGIDKISKFDATSFACQVAAEVRDFTAAEWMPPREVPISDPFLHYSLASATMALRDSGLLEDPSRGLRTGTCMATGAGGLNVVMAQQNNLFHKGPRFVSPMAVPFTICDIASGYISIQHKLLGPNHAIVSACASGASAIGEGYWMIQRGSVDAMLVGGAESLTPLNTAAFAAARALTTSNDCPQTASRPFDLGRNGFVLGEGAASLILEDKELADARGAKIYGEVVGYGSTADAYHVTSPDPAGGGSTRAIQEALKMAGIGPEQIDHVNAHATSTVVGDKIEAATLRQVFAKTIDNLPVSATKSMTGHMIGAAGAIEAVFCLLAARDGICPPTINQFEQDPECVLDTVPNQARAKVLEYTMSNSFGFGGHNVSLVFRRI